MRSLTFEILLIVGSVIGAWLCLSSLRQSAKRWGRVLAFFVGCGLLLACLYYYAHTGRTIEETIACAIFSDGEACRGRTVPPPVAERAEGTPPPRPREVHQPIEGWWPVGTPAASAATLRSADALWRWAENHPGSCEPFRQFVGFFPQDSRAAEARRRQSNERQRIAERWAISRGNVAQTSRSGRFAQSQPDAEACESLVQGYSNDLLASWCDGMARGRRRAAPESGMRFLEVEAALQPGGCRCSDDWFSDEATCTARLERWCAYRQIERVPVEICSG